uniref:DOD-type homing endonuclease domain-containing protein n=1 Tax=viral metagenome TaxID=1070528 RepID=A0A6C0DIQ3_9ZZZZ
MNPLDILKQKLMIKPSINEEEPVIVAIRGELKLDKIPIEKEEGEISEDLGPIELKIVDETNQGYDRTKLFKKMVDNKVSRVKVRGPPLVPETVEPITPIIVEKIEAPKKATKLVKKKLVILEDNFEKVAQIGPDNFEKVAQNEPDNFEKVAQNEPDNFEKVAQNEPIIPTEKKALRKTPKVEKGIAVLGPENMVEIGNTPISDRLAKKAPPVIINVSSYYMNNRELFVNFINSLFEPYKKELESMKANISCDDIGKDSGDFSLLTHQKIVRDYINLFTPYRGLLLYHGLGAGKCMRKGTPIIMSNGEIKLIENIQVGDLLMGDDSTPRTVTSLARGRDKMYDISPVKGEKYTVNQEHILCLRASGFPKFSCNNHKSNTNYNIQWLENNEFLSKTFTFNPNDLKNKEEMKQQATIFFENIQSNSKTNDNVYEIAVKDYLHLSDKKKGFLKGYRVAIDFPEKELPLDPYMIGYWLGDGHSNHSTITSQDSTVVYYFAKNVSKYNLIFDYKSNYHYSIKGVNSEKNFFLTTLKDLNLLNNKHIPMIYKCNSRENRLKLLAGLIDSDGCLCNNGGFEFTQKNEAMMNDVIYLARSLGFSCYKACKKTSWTHNGVKNYGTAWRININGKGLENVPTLIPRKQSSSRQQIKDVLVTGISVEYVGEDDYYGFTLDGNCRYLIGDFTVTHNTCSSIAIAEGMKDTKKIIIMLPASLRTNYMEELKRCGDFLYKKNQYWEFVSTEKHPEALQTLSAILNLSQEYIQKRKGAWFINIKKPSNYEQLNSVDKKSLDEQLNEMIMNKYTFINYNGLRIKRLEELTSGFTKNLFDNSVIIIDEAHNLISRIVNKIKKEKAIPENEKGEKEYSPKFLSIKLYEYLMSAKNARIVMLTGTPIINYPNEFGILFNILRGYIKTWNIPLNVKSSKKIDKNTLNEMLLGEKSLDYLDYSPSSKILTITRNPFGFKNKIKSSSGYQGVSNVKKDENRNNIFDSDFISDDDFERRIIGILRKNDIEVLSDGIKIKNMKALPDDFDIFENQYIDSVTKQLKNIDSLKRRIIGLSSYFKSAQESLLPVFNKKLSVDYHIVRIPMSDFQFKIYESARKEERKLEKSSKKPQKLDDLYKEATSTYRIFSRLYCNFVMPERPMPNGKRKQVSNDESNAAAIEDLLKQAQKEESNVDVNNENEGEEEGDQILDKLGGVTYKEQIDAAIQNIKEHSDDYLTVEALTRFSPKFLHILENIKDPEYIGLHLVYSQFRTLEGIGLFSLVLEKNGFARFKLKKNALDIWQIDIPDEDMGKPTYALYTGTESTEEKEIIRRIYNGEWDYIPTNLSSELKKIANNNNMGEIIKVLMITSSGSEGINLRNTRYVHIMEPYWHPVRTEQVIGRARRICSHKNLPRELQTVEVFVYLMTFSADQLKSDDAIELKRKDLSKGEPKVPVTSDQLLYEISEIKANLSSQLTEAIKESAFDCYIYSNGKCMNFGDPNNTKFSYVPDYTNQQNDITVRANKKKIEWEGKPIKIKGEEYVYRRMSNTLLNIYDKTSYLEALKNPDVNPVQIGKLEINDRGEQVFKQLIT